MLVYDIGLGKVRDSFVIDTQKLIAETFIEVHLPVIAIEVDTLVKDLYSGLMAPDQVQRTSKLLEIITVNWVEQVALFEQLERFVDFSLDPQNERL